MIIAVRSIKTYTIANVASGAPRFIEIVIINYVVAARVRF